MNHPDPDSPGRTSPDALSQAHRGPDWWLMFRKFLTQGRSIASVAPSSRFLVRAILRGIDFSATRCVVELGAGTGPITVELLRRAKPHPDCRVIVIERDPDFCRRLRTRFPEADVVEADAADLDGVLAERSIAQADQVISGLPMPSLPLAVRDGVLGAVGRRLSPRGEFRQLTVLPWVYYKFYRAYFERVRFNLVGLNLPPGGVYVCQGCRA